MDKQIPKELNRKQLQALKATLETINTDIRVIEKVIGPLFMEANRKRILPIINFCHDVLQSLRLTPIYVRNILKKLPETVENKSVIEDDVRILIQGLLVTLHETVTRHKSAYVSPENLFEIMRTFCRQPDYSTFGIEEEIAKINIRAVKLNRLEISLRQVLDPA